jgi:hypothetical protein
MKATKAQTTMKDMKAKTTMKAKTEKEKEKEKRGREERRKGEGRELDSEEHLSDDHYADDDFDDEGNPTMESKVEKDDKKVNKEKVEAKKKCFSEEHLEEMRMRYREYEFDTEIEELLAKYTAGQGSNTGTSCSSGKEGEQLQPLPQPADNEPAPV